LSYERVRAEVLAGQARPDALGAIVYHGMWRGLRVLLGTSITASTSRIVSPPMAPPTGTLDRQLVRLLADMVLATQPEVDHVH
jgi:hypothetical protein